MRAEDNKEARTMWAKNWSNQAREDPRPSSLGTVCQLA
jgi:hypothetical protein